MHGCQNPKCIQTKSGCTNIEGTIKVKCVQPQQN